MVGIDWRIFVGAIGAIGTIVTVLILVVVKNRGIRQDCGVRFNGVENDISNLYKIVNKNLQNVVAEQKQLVVMIRNQHDLLVRVEDSVTERLKCLEEESKERSGIEQRLSTMEKDVDGLKRKFNGMGKKKS